MYILSLSSTDYCSDDWQDYAIDIPLNAANLLSDEKFLEEYDYLFGKGITGYNISLNNERLDCWKMVVQYLDFDGDYEEVEFYLHSITLVNSFGVQRGE